MNKQNNSLGLFDNMDSIELESLLKECGFNFSKVNGVGGVFISEDKINIRDYDISNFQWTVESIKKMESKIGYTDSRNLNFFKGKIKNEFKYLELEYSVEAA
jgi:hypothetical protein